MSARKPDELRIRRNKPDIAWTDVENTPRPGRVPAAPEWSAFGPAAKQWWKWAWKLPVARLWGEEEMAVAARRAEMQDRWAGGDSKVANEMRQCETILLLTPAARRLERVRLVREGEIVEENGAPVADELAARRLADKIAL